MSVFRCASCDLNYCTTCDGGIDACKTCCMGPLCDDCASDHETEHLATEEEKARARKEEDA